jgi:hypothetical protein
MKYPDQMLYNRVELEKDLDENEMGGEGFMDEI